MRISELLAARVVDERGREVGCVRDVRLARERAGSGHEFEVTGLVVGPPGMLSVAAHAWGYAEGRAQGPLLLRALTGRAVRGSRFVPARRVVDWTLPRLRIRGSFDQLEALGEGRGDE